MVLDFSSSFKMYDEDTGQLYRDCRVSIHGDGDKISMDYIKNMVSTMTATMGAIIDDIEY